jgi:hypothetical protein
VRHLQAPLRSGRASTGAQRTASSVDEVDRQCARPGCAEPAVATLTYHYSRGTAWLDELTPEREPHRYDLCHRHAARIGVPSGWRFDDRRLRLHSSGATSLPPEAIPVVPAVAATPAALPEPLVPEPVGSASLASAPVASPAAGVAAASGLAEPAAAPPDLLPVAPPRPATIDLPAATRLAG